MPALEFGVFDTLAPMEPGAGRWADVYDRHIKDAQLAEQLGYQYFFFIEHQNAEFPVVSSPTVYLGAIARATSTIRIGAMIFQVPLHHPVRLAQDTAMIDHLSRGRLEFAIGYGTRTREFKPWRADFGQRREMGVEAIEILLKAWTQKRFSYGGKYWSFDDASPQPQPYQAPHPPMWMGGHSHASFDYAAKMGFGVAQNMDVENLIAEKFEYFHDSWKRHGRSGRPRTLIVRHIHVAETDRQAREEAEPYMLQGLVGKDGVRRALSLRKEEATPEMIEVARVYLETARSYDFWIEEGLGFVGSPQTVARQIEKQCARVGYDVFLANHRFGTMPHELVRKSLKLFGEQVIPSFAPVFPLEVHHGR